MPEAANPTAKKILGEMFGGEGKEARETAKAEAGESRAAAAAEETAERVGCHCFQWWNGRGRTSVCAGWCWGGHSIVLGAFSDGYVVGFHGISL